MKELLEPALSKCCLGCMLREGDLFGPGSPANINDKESNQHIPHHIARTSSGKYPPLAHQSCVLGERAARGTPFEILSGEMLSGLYAKGRRPFRSRHITDKEFNQHMRHPLARYFLGKYLSLLHQSCSLGERAARAILFEMSSGLYAKETFLVPVPLPYSETVISSWVLC